MVKGLRNTAIILCIISIALFTNCIFYPSIQHPAGALNVVVDTIAKDLTVPWDICFLPNDDLLFTERNGKVRLFRDNTLQDLPVLTIPDIEVKGKMGLLGMCLHPGFTLNHKIYLAYNYRMEGQTFLRVVSYTYLKERLVSPQVIIEGIPGVFNHTGCRLKFGPDLKLYITTGDADIPRLSQDIKVFNGKILRLNDDGSIPADNPLKGDSVRREIWSYGHRNPQGISFQPGTGLLFSSEHGPTGGDEINIIRKGGNYGWPVVHHREIQEPMISPVMEFSPSIGPAATLFYTGKAFPSLKGNLLVGCMRGEAILNIQLRDSEIKSYNYLLKKTFGRIRAIAEDSRGYIYISTSQVDPPESRLQTGERDYDLILRLRPADSRDPENRIIRISTINELTEAINDSRAARVNSPGRKPEMLYLQLCAGCHGQKMQGKESTPSLVDKLWLNGGSKEAISRSISEGIIKKGMPAWKGVLSDKEIDAIRDLILRSTSSRPGKRPPHFR
ncbi:PQQ-dependent sugar dehydrogenase [Desertivirga arenae]|uniref:PQQ-dependent sugar dehydrogenase n=1 Tax=Desertivirga arenae TaxID=2810309 RepID=UPI001A95793B|nr:PQQ-dependent sugar dehydrogenase [Pedobacter sp. SYSU D00823]